MCLVALSFRESGSVPRSACPETLRPAFGTASCLPGLLSAWRAARREEVRRMLSTPDTTCSCLAHATVGTTAAVGAWRKHLQCTLCLAFQQPGGCAPQDTGKQAFIRAGLTDHGQGRVTDSPPLHTDRHGVPGIHQNLLSQSTRPDQMEFPCQAKLRREAVKEWGEAPEDAELLGSSTCRECSQD